MKEDNVRRWPGHVPDCGDGPAGVIKVYPDTLLEVDTDVCVQ